MKEMALEYRRSAAMVAMRIEEKIKEGAPIEEIESLKTSLREIRVIQRTLDSYYSSPRPDEYYNMTKIVGRRTNE